MKKATRILPAAAFLLFPAIAWAESPAPDSDSIITIQGENDAFSVPSTDELYTSGLRLGYVTPTGALPQGLAQFGNQVFGDGTQRLEFDIQQVIFTPTNTQLYDPNPRDEPYAAQLALHTSLIQDTMDTRSIAQASLGLVGPDALGQSVQNGFHDIIGDSTNKGWRYQLRNEPTLDFFGARIWREDIIPETGGIGLQLLPQVSAQVGTTEIYAQAGAIIRFGEGLDSDFGPAVIQPAQSGADAYTPTQPFAWYIFGGATGRFMAHDLFFQGNYFEDSRSVSMIPLQGDLEAGAAVMLYGFRLSATEIFTTPQFHGAAPAFQYGSVALSGRF